MICVYLGRKIGNISVLHMRFALAAANKQRVTAATSQDTIKHTMTDDPLKWTAWFGSQGRKLTEKVIAPQGTLSFLVKVCSVRYTTLSSSIVM